MTSRRASALVLWFSLVLLAACVGGTADGVDAVGAPVVEEQAEDVSSVDGEPATATPAGTCVAAQLLGILHRPEPNGLEPPEMPQDVEGDELWAAVSEGLPTDLAVDWDRLIEARVASVDDPDPLAEEVEVPPYVTVEAVVRSLGEHCQTDGPFWGCVAQDHAFPIVDERFSPVDEIDDPVAPPGAAQSSDPRALADELDHPGELVLVGEEERVQLYAWVDEAGLASRSLEVVAVDDGWSRGTESWCVGAAEAAELAEEKFETVGEAIESSDPTEGRPDQPEGTVWSSVDGEWVVPYERRTDPSGEPFMVDQDGFDVGMDECRWYRDQGDDQLDRWCDDQGFS